MRGKGLAMRLSVSAKRAQKSIHATGLFTQFYKDAFLLYIICMSATMPPFQIYGLFVPDTEWMQIQMTIVMNVPLKNGGGKDECPIPA